MPPTLDEAAFLEAIQFLAEKDVLLGSVIKRYGLPPFWQREPGFATLIQIILEQQVSLASARAVFERLKTHLGAFSPEKFVATGESGLRRLGLTRQKAKYCHQVAEQVVNGRFSFEELHQKSDKEAIDYLCQLKGVGSWTAEVYLLMAMRRPDVWPAKDLALIKAISQLYGLEGQVDSPELTVISKKWQPYRAVAARILWHFYLSQKR